MMLSLVQASVRLNPAMAGPRAPMVPGRITTLATSSIRQSRSLLPCHEPLQSRRAFSSITPKEVIKTSGWLLMIVVGGIAGSLLGCHLLHAEYETKIKYRNIWGTLMLPEVLHHGTIDGSELWWVVSAMLKSHDLEAVKEMILYFRNLPQSSIKISSLRKDFQYEWEERIIRTLITESACTLYDSKLTPIERELEYFKRVALTKLALKKFDEKTLSKYASPLIFELDDRHAILRNAMIEAGVPH